MQNTPDGIPIGPGTLTGYFGGTIWTPWSNGN